MLFSVLMKGSGYSMIAVATAVTYALLVAVGADAATYIVKASNGDKIQDALDILQPGDTVEIEEGDYWEDITTMVDGTVEEPITIRGSGDVSEIRLRGSDDNDYRLMHIRHDNYIVEGFTIDGMVRETDSINYQTDIRNKLLYVLPEREHTERSGGYRSALDGLVVRNMVLKNAGGECLRLRYFVTNAEIYDNEITNCGIYDFVYSANGKNGEGIYVGTAVNQWANEWNPTDEPDVCMNIHIHHNVIDTNGNEGVQLKEGTAECIIENNKIFRQLDRSSGAIDIRGDRCIVRENYIEDAEGAGVRIGGFNGYGTNNDVYKNEIVNSKFAGIKISRAEQGNICGNTFDLPSGVTEAEYKLTTGEGRNNYPDPRMPCPEDMILPTTVSSEPPMLIVGCYEDRVEDRIMSRGFTSEEGMTNKNCGIHCKVAGFDYSGTQYSSECWCTNSSSDFKKAGESTECDMKCSGDPMELCGGIDVMTVSETSSYDAPSGFEGCFKDAEYRLLDEESTQSSDMSIEMCVDFCNDEGRDYAGLEAGNECWCGDSKDFDEYDKATNCDLPCVGNPSESCGGQWAIAVWDVNDYKACSVRCDF